MTRRNDRTWHQVTAAPLDPELAHLLALLPEQDYDAMTPQAHRASLLAMSATLAGRSRTASHALT